MPLTPTANWLIPKPALADAASIETAVGPISDRLEVIFNTLLVGLVPLGGIIGYAGSSDPAAGTDGVRRWLLADGRLIDRTTYAAFYTAVAHKYNGGVDPGSNKVRIPDLRGRVMVGADNMRSTTDFLGNAASGAAGRLPNSNRVAGQNGGEERHQTTIAEMASHTHGSYPIDGSHQAAYQVGTGGNRTLPAGTDWAWAFYNNQNTGGDTPHNNMQPYEVDNMLVRIA